jgi:hypothetical protein
VLSGCAYGVLLVVETLQRFLNHLTPDASLEKFGSYPAGTLGVGPLPFLTPGMGESPIVQIASRFEVQNRCLGLVVGETPREALSHLGLAV